MLGEDADAFEHSEEALVSYEVEILTGTVSGAGTKAKVFIDLEGAEGGRPRRSGRRVLNTPGQPFDKGKIARFTFDCTALGELKNMKIGHDDSGFSANWFCEKVTIKRANSAQQWEISVGKVLRTELPLSLSPFPFPLSPVPFPLSPFPLSPIPFQMCPGSPVSRFLSSVPCPLLAAK